MEVKEPEQDYRAIARKLAKTPADEQAIFDALWNAHADGLEVAAFLCFKQGEEANARAFLGRAKKMRE